MNSVCADMGTLLSAPKYGMPSAVQRAIASPAILAQIHAQLSPGWNSVKDPDNTDDEDGREDRASLRSALAACTRVCRSFSGPALDTQWRVLDDVAVLLRILPHTVSHPGNDSGSEDGLDMNPARLNVLTLSSDIDDSAWMKFREFARRVRELNTAPPSYFIHPDVWNTLATRLQGTPLLPRLQRLHISMIYNDPTSFVLCLSPTLRHLSFQFCDDHGAPMVTNDEFVQNILAVISAPRELPSSSCIQLARQALPECTEAVVQHLCSIGRLSHLEVLNLVPAVSPVEVPALRALSTLSSLRSLKLVVPSRGEDKDDPLNLEGLATIRHLHLSGTVEDIYGFMSAIPPADLRDLSLCIRGSNAHAIAGAFRGLKRYLPDALESLECTFCGPISKGSKAILRLFHPFLKYHLLKRFSVHMVMGHGMNISDNALRTIGSSWPNLERFALRCGEMLIGPAMTAVRPTIAALIELVRGCPQLQFIRLLGLDVDALPSDDIIPEEGHARLRYLDPCMFVNDEKADLEEVARVLDRLFPDLADFPHKYVDYNTTKDTVSWDKVQELMRARRAARKLKVDIVHDGLSHEVRSDDSLAMISLVLL